MAARKLPNYLRTHRRRVGYSQEDLACLLGGKEGNKISRYERRECLPSLKTALAYEAIFGVPVQELFAGVYEEVEKNVHIQAEALAFKLYTEKPNPVTARKLEH
jgi:transcriptional regulator with XRE-family HTH domain